MQRGREEPDIEQIFREDNFWIQLMNNQVYHRELFESLLRDKRIKEPVAYGGALYYANPGMSVKALMDVETHDILVPGGSFEQPQLGYQHYYSSIEEYFREHPPISEGLTIYFFGDAHRDSGRVIAIHWNCVVVDTLRHEVIWYDPAFDEEMKKESVYDFNQEKMTHILLTIADYLPAFELRKVYGAHRAQQVCYYEYDCVDAFCQTWVLMFASSVIEGTMWRFLSLPFDKFATLIIKAWVYCKIRSTPGWELPLRQMLSFQYCRLPVDVRRSPLQTRIQKAPHLLPSPSHTCLDAVYSYIESLLPSKRRR